jgi:ABC-type transport system involved in multi-copper enzyme maturation permease subunit
VVSLLLGLSYSDYNEFAIITSDLEYIVAFFIKLVGFFSFGLFLGILVKRSAFAIGAMVVWLIGESIFKGYLFYSLKNTENTSEQVDGIMQFLPLEAMTNLIKEPFSRLGAVRSVANQVGETITKSYAVDFSTILIVCVWTFVFVYLSLALLKKRDL